MPLKHIFPDQICHFGHLVRYSTAATILVWVGPVKERSVINSIKQQNDGKSETIKAKEATNGKSIDTFHQEAQG